jgi:enoyl-CoA hydratase
MILTGRGVSGEEALRMGLANRLVPKGTALAAAVKLAKEIAAFPQSCYARGPDVVLHAMGPRRRGGAPAETRTGFAVVQQGDMLEGVQRLRGGRWGRHGKFGES